MPITTSTRMGKKLFLSLLLAVATAIPENAQAISTVGNHAHPASFQGIERNLAYVPYEKGTVVRFDDQDGAWMLGVIYDYDSSTQTYTIQWAEDNLNENFTDLTKVENMVNSAKENSNTIDFKVSEGGEKIEGFQFPYHYPYDDLSEYQAWPTGTPVLLEFADGWFMGEITDFSMSDDNTGATYVVAWSDGATDTFFNELEWVDLMVANAADYQPWETGTPTYGYGQEPFLSGEIINWDRGVYSITWSNGDIVKYYDFDLIDTFVTGAANNIDSSWIDKYEPWPMDTGVMWIFDDGFVEGNITGFARGTYTVMWSDGSVKLYSNLQKVDQMVAFYNGVGYLGKLAQPSDYTEMDQTYDTYYALETVVYAQFQDGWWAGYIDSYENEYYVIRWSDNSVDKFLPGEAMDDMVRNAKNIPKDYAIWEVGTRVRQKYEGKWYSGSIETSNAGFYTVVWDDGSRSTYVSGPEMDEMVKKAYKTKFSFGNIAIALIVFGCAGFAVFFAKDKNRKKLAAFREQVRANELGFSDNENAGYQDEEPRLPKIA